MFYGPFEHAVRIPLFFFLSLALDISYCSVFSLVGRSLSMCCRNDTPINADRRYTLGSVVFFQAYIKYGSTGLLFALVVTRTNDGTFYCQYTTTTRLREPIYRCRRAATAMTVSPSRKIFEMPMFSINSKSKVG